MIRWPGPNNIRWSKTIQAPQREESQALDGVLFHPVTIWLLAFAGLVEN